MHLDARPRCMGEPDDICERVEIGGTLDVLGARLVREVEVRIARLAYLYEQRVDVRAVRVGDQLFNLRRRLDPVMKGVHPERPVLRRSEHDRAWRRTRRDRRCHARILSRACEQRRDQESYRTRAGPARLRGVKDPLWRSHQACASSTWFLPLVTIVPGWSRLRVSMASSMMA